MRPKKIKKKIHAAEVVTEKAALAKKSTDGKTEAPSKKFTEPTFNIEFQYAGKAIPYDEIVKRAKEATGGKDNINIYVKPEENRVYYVAESDVGSFEI